MAKKPVITTAMRQLDALGVPYHAIYHKPTYDAEGAAAACGVGVNQIVKSLLVQLPGKRYALVLMQGNRKLSLHKLSTFLGVKGIELAPHDQVVVITGYEPGSVSPMGLKRRLAVVLDEAALELTEAVVSGGKHEVAIALTPQDLARATNARVADVSQ